MTAEPTPPGDTSFLSGDSLEEQIAAAMAAERAGQAHGATGKVLKHAFVDLRRRTLREVVRGDRIAARLAKGVDDIVRTLFALSKEGVGKDIAVCAVGGYGRSELAPYSDIDLLFLHRPQVEKTLRDTLNRLLYPLWDSGVKLGYGAHTPASAVEFAKSDIVARTAYLDARFLCGARDVYDEFHAGFDKLRRKTVPEFVAAKLEEQNERQAKFFETRYLVEPDIKEAKGGLRDVQTIRWIYRYAYGDILNDAKEAERIVGKAERQALLKAKRFLWSVRVHLHDLRGRADEKLTFDVQPEIAERLGYADRKNMTAAERLMKHYFVNAVEVGRLTRILCARLEEEKAKRLPRLPRFLPRALQEDEAPGKPNLRINNGRLDFESAAKARRQPRDLFRLFRAYGKQPKIDFHPDALAIVTEQVPNVTTPVRRDPVVARLFAGILTDSEDSVRVLRIMTETGLLGKYIPAFGSIVGRIDYGLYRRFTIDEHVLRCVGLLRQIHRCEIEEEHPIASVIVSNAQNPLLYYYGVLLHEARWSLKESSVDACEKLVIRVTKRLGLNDEEAALAGWAAARHLMLVRTAERRNITEPRAISAFAQSVGSRARLDMMLVLSVCHLRVVGFQSWDEMTRLRLAELYDAAALWFDHGEEALGKSLNDRAKHVRKEAKERLSGWSEKEKTAFLDRLDDSMMRSLDPDIIVRFATLARAAEKDAANSAVVVTPRDGDLEAIVYTDDRAGLLSDLAGAVASTGMSVRTVQALTTDDGKAIDIFIVQSPDGVPVEDMEQGKRLHEALFTAAAAPPDRPPELRRRLGDRREIFSVKSEVRIEREASEEAAVVEAEGLDRPGLLYELTRALAREGATITSAHIATYGERAVDAFYLQTKDGRKLEDAAALARIKKALGEVLAAGSDD
ncbi:[protein-PII] uridylyltransferase [Hyphococcus luteus]|uniref:Bifunctional uridylyltransferase/uridylyl-removing enzyme n=1 Tax=Hyphococcus luteus TaxID=2058213 RepID=A0A2S7K7W1_9PROT|nr:[protein-PII] uridylyltransferase [Marinicaulis flavus]PQA88607.1 [protein-PII] uridylyltransferase [Marinicaulis flavus]